MLFHRHPSLIRMNVNCVIVSYLPHVIMSIPKRHMYGSNHVIQRNIRTGYWARRSIYVVCVIGKGENGNLLFFTRYFLTLCLFLLDCTVLFIGFIPIKNLLNSIVPWICCCRVIRYVNQDYVICGAQYLDFMVAL